MVKNAIIIVFSAVLAAVAAWLLLSENDVTVPDEPSSPPKKVAQAARPVRATHSNESDRRESVSAQLSSDDSSGAAKTVAQTTAADTKLMDDLIKCRNDENLEEMTRLVALAVKSENPEVRRDALDTIRVFGKSGMAEATMFMCDADEDVRNEAFDVWRSALFEFDDDKEKAKHILMAMTAVTDREQLDLMTQQITELDDFNRMNTLVTLITGKNAAAKEIALKEYKDLTETEFTTVEAAQAWLNEQGDESNESESETEETKNEK